MGLEPRRPRSCDVLRQIVDEQYSRGLHSEGCEAAAIADDVGLRRAKRGRCVDPVPEQGPEFRADDVDVLGQQFRVVCQDRDSLQGPQPFYQREDLIIGRDRSATRLQPLLQLTG